MATLIVIAVNFIWSGQPVKACTRAVYIGPDNMVITGRTMDWKEDIQSNLFFSLAVSNGPDIIKEIR